MPAILKALEGSRPEFPLVGQLAAEYGFVVEGGTSAQAVPVYEVMAENFSAYWAGQQDLATTVQKVQTRMAERIAAK